MKKKCLIGDTPESFLNKLEDYKWKDHDEIVLNPLNLMDLFCNFLKMVIKNYCFII